MSCSNRVGSLLSWAASELADSDSARLDAELLLARVLGKDRTWLYTYPEYLIDASRREAFHELLARRRAGEPVAFLLGYREFWSLQLEVSPATLIPRPETEVLVEQALKLELPTKAKVLDLGTGTGAIALALASERPQWNICAVEQSPDALALAQRNRDRLKLAVDLRLGSWFTPLARGEKFDLIVSNPPYVEQNSPWLKQGDVRFEPSSALQAGEDGLDAIREIVREAPSFLNAGGWLLVEHGYQQAEAVQTLFSRANLREICTLPDLSGRGRAGLGRKGTS